MKKIWTITAKDLLIVFREPGVLIMMILTPFALTLAIAFAFGGLTGGSSSTLADIPVTVVNQDSGDFGARLVELLQSPDMATLLEPTVTDDTAAARAAVDQDKSVAAVIIPANLSESLLPAGMKNGGAASRSQPQAIIEFYVNPTRTVSAGVVQGVVERFLRVAATGVAAGQITVEQLLTHNLISPQQAGQVGTQLGESAGQRAIETELITVKSEGTIANSRPSFDWLSYMAPSMAIMFLMFTVVGGGRSILAERDAGTLPRLLATPSSAAQVLGGKVIGVFLTGMMQLLILYLASSTLFDVQWGPAPAVLLLSAAVAAAATSWGMLIAAYSRTPRQVNEVGNALALIFAGLAGNFVPRQILPDVLRTASYVSPNAWGLDGFTSLAGGGTLADVIPQIIALLIMAAIVLSVAVVAFRRQYR